MATSIGDSFSPLKATLNLGLNGGMSRYNYQQKQNNIHTYQLSLSSDKIAWLKSSISASTILRACIIQNILFSLR
jgi:hypothetical protein